MALANCSLYAVGQFIGVVYRLSRLTPPGIFAPLDHRGSISRRVELCTIHSFFGYLQLSFFCRFTWLIFFAVRLFPEIGHIGVGKLIGVLVRQKASRLCSAELQFGKSKPT